MPWARLDQQIISSPFFRSLNESEKGVFVCIIAFAAGKRGRFKYYPERPDLLADDLHVTQATVTSVIEKGISFRIKATDEPPIKLENDYLILTAWEKFQPDPTGAERQRRFKAEQEKQIDNTEVTEARVTTVSNDNVTRRNGTLRNEKKKKNDSYESSKEKEFVDEIIGNPNSRSGNGKREHEILIEELMAAIEQYQTTETEDRKQIISMAQVAFSRGFKESIRGLIGNLNESPPRNAIAVAIAGLKKMKPT